MPFLMGAPLPPRLVVVGGGGGPSGLQFILPSTGEIDGGGGHMVWTCPSSDSQSIVMPGSTSVTYDLELRFVGVVEEAQYIGGTTIGSLNIDGSAGLHPGQNTYRLTTSDPAHTYFFNAGWIGTGFPDVGAIDFTHTIPVVGGATITLLASAGDGLEEKHSLSVGGVTDPAQPYLGQWINVEVVSIVEVP